MKNQILPDDHIPLSVLQEFLECHAIPFRNFERFLEDKKRKTDNKLKKHIAKDVDEDRLVLIGGVPFTRKRA